MKSNLLVGLILVTLGGAIALPVSYSLWSQHQKKEFLRDHFGSFLGRHVRCSYVLALKGTSFYGYYDDPARNEPVMIQDMIMLECLEVYRTIYHPKAKPIRDQDLAKMQEEVRRELE